MVITIIIIAFLYIIIINSYLNSIICAVSILFIFLQQKGSRIQMLAEKASVIKMHILVSSDILRYSDSKGVGGIWENINIYTSLTMAYT